MRHILLLVILLISLTSYAKGWILLKEDENVAVLYKWKKDKQGQEELRVKLKNRSSSDVVLALEIGFYDTGVLAEKSFTADCLKKGLVRNWFREIHLIQSESEGVDLSKMNIEVIEIKSTKVDWCETTEP